MDFSLLHKTQESHCQLTDCSSHNLSLPTIGRDEQQEFLSKIYQVKALFCKFYLHCPQNEGKLASSTPRKPGMLQPHDLSKYAGRKRKEKTTQAVKANPHINQGKGATLVPSTVKLLHRKKKRENQWGSRGVAGLA